ncbi:ABC transporter permease [Paenibacillus roseipurpureus]|uniref:ABC transporter permease subunit n=1 Tax=Paenibacillus roseopurpureus TaxID=2918901 RepID=A0AA96LKL3_9BACL|nr:ABC transporter permease subunit [Paenibacillus sp. MBLB1832]WNR42822.1 ABC transporter permease subunit [Paenibacillus sp. MBLB1832]
METNALSQTVPGVRKVSRKSTLRKNVDYTLLALPALVLMIVFNFVPLPGIILAFKNYNFVAGIFGSPWVGFKNFTFIFSTNDALLALKNTLVYNAAFIITGISGSVLLAILLNEVLSRKMLKAYQTAIFLPYFLSWTIVAYIVFALLDNSKGMVNFILHGLGFSTVEWYFNPQYWFWIHVILHFWKLMGYSTLLNYAYILSVDPAYYEAASIDGASRFQMAMKITLPALRPIILINFLLALGRIFNADFGQFFLVPLESPALHDVSSVLDTYVYSALRGGADLGMGAAAGLFQSFAGFVLVLAVNFFIRYRNGRESAMF